MHEKIKKLATYMQKTLNNEEDNYEYYRKKKRTGFIATLFGI